MEILVKTLIKGTVVAAGEGATWEIGPDRQMTFTLLSAEMGDRVAAFEEVVPVAV